MNMMKDELFKAVFREWMTCYGDLESLTNLLWEEDMESFLKLEQHIISTIMESLSMEQLEDFMTENISKRELREVLSNLEDKGILEKIHEEKL